MLTQAVTVTAKEAPNIIIGRRGAYDTEQVVFDISYLIETFGAGEAVLLVKRPNDETAYPAETVQDGNTLTWLVTDIDTSYKGHGEAELFWYVDSDGGLAKSVIYSIAVLRDIGTTTETPPDPYESWVDTLVELGAETLANAQAAEDAKDDAVDAKLAAQDAQAGAERAQDAAETAQGKAETAQGKAEDAQEAAEVALEEFTTPTASAETLSPGSSATASYASGHFTFGIPQGEQGEQGNPGTPGAAAGFGTVTATVDANVGTPSVEVSSSGPDTAKEFSFAFHNLKGVQGDPGTPGEDGVIQSVNGKSAASITLDAGDIGYDSSETYTSGTVGAEITALSSEITQLTPDIYVTQQAILQNLSLSASSRELTIINGKIHFRVNNSYNRGFVINKQIEGISSFINAAIPSYIPPVELLENIIAIKGCNLIRSYAIQTTTASTPREFFVIAFYKYENDSVTYIDRVAVATVNGYGVTKFEIPEDATHFITACFQAASNSTTTDAIVSISAEDTSGMALALSN